MERNWKLPSSRRVSMADSRKRSLASERELVELKKVGKTELQVFWQRSAKVPLCSVLFGFKSCKSEMCTGLWFQSRFQNCSREIFFSPTRVYNSTAVSQMSHCPYSHFKCRASTVWYEAKQNPSQLVIILIAPAVLLPSNVSADWRTKTCSEEKVKTGESPGRGSYRRK